MMMPHDVLSPRTAMRTDSSAGVLRTCTKPQYLLSLVAVLVAGGIVAFKHARTVGAAARTADGPAPVARARLAGINHVALEVDDIDEALAFYGRIFEVSLRGRVPGGAFIDIGDQFIALSAGRAQPPDHSRHFGLVVDDREATRRALDAAGTEILPGRGLEFRDPSGNRVQVVQYDEVQFSKTPAVLRGMGLFPLTKTPSARKELRRKGLA